MIILLFLNWLKTAISEFTPPSEEDLVFMHSDELGQINQRIDGGMEYFLACKALESACLNLKDQNRAIAASIKELTEIAENLTKYSDEIKDNEFKIGKDITTNEKLIDDVCKYLEYKERAITTFGRLADVCSLFSCRKGIASIVLNSLSIGEVSRRPRSIIKKLLEGKFIEKSVDSYRWELENVNSESEKIIGGLADAANKVDIQVRFNARDIVVRVKVQDIKIRMRRVLGKEETKKHFQKLDVAKSIDKEIQERYTAAINNFFDGYKHLMAVKEKAKLELFPSSELISSNKEMIGWVSREINLRPGPGAIADLSQDLSSIRGILLAAATDVKNSKINQEIENDSYDYDRDMFLSDNELIESAGKTGGIDGIGMLCGIVSLVLIL